MQTKTNPNLVRQNLRLVKQVYPGLATAKLTALRKLTQTLDLSLAGGEVLCLDGRWYITHAGLLRLAARENASEFVRIAGATMRSRRQSMGF